MIVQTWLTNCPAERRALLKVAHPVLTKCLQPSNPSKPLCSWFPRGFPRIQGGVLSASREGGAAENQSLCPSPPTHNRTGTAQLSSRRCNYVAIHKKHMFISLRIATSGNTHQTCTQINDRIFVAMLAAHRILTVFLIAYPLGA